MLNRNTPPPFVTDTSFSILEPHWNEFSNGIICGILPERGCKVIKLDMIFEAGQWYEEKPGISYFATHLLDKGSQSKTAKQIADFFDLYGAHIELNSGRDFVSVSLQILSKHWNTLLPFFFEMLSNPVFPNEELEQLKETFLQQRLIKEQRTDWVASKLIMQKVFGHKHPYGWVTEEEHLNSHINTDYLKIFFDNHINVSHVFIAGDVTDEMEDYIKSHFSSLPAHLSVEKNAVSDKSFGPYRHSCDKERTVQSSIYLGKRTLSGNHPDYFAMVLLTYHLGGYFGSQLMKNLREEKGLTYGVFSSINVFKHGSMLLIGADVNKENEKQAIQEIKNEIDKLVQHKIKDKNLLLARHHFIGTLQADVSGLFSIMEKIKNRTLRELPYDFYQNMIDAVDTISPDELLSVAQRHFNYDTFSNVSVG